MLGAVLGPLQSGKAEILTGLSNYWPLDESSGMVGHDVVGGNNVALQSFPAGQTIWTPGKINGSLNFTNSTNYVRTASPMSFNQYTIDFWLKVNGPGGINPRLVGPADGLYAWVILNSQYHRGVGLYYHNGGSLVQDPNPPAPGVWENYAVTIDLTFSKAAVFRNGVQVAQGPFSDNVPQLFWSFGHNQDPANQLDGLNGQLDEIRIYNRILSPTDIAQLVPEPSAFILAAVGVLAMLGCSVARRGAGRRSVRRPRPIESSALSGR